MVPAHASVILTPHFFFDFVFYVPFILGGHHEYEVLSLKKALLARGLRVSHHVVLTFLSSVFLVAVLISSVHTFGLVLSSNLLKPDWFYLHGDFLL